MAIRQLQTGDEILLERFLSHHAETTMFMRYNLQAAGLNYQQESYHGEYFGSFDNAGAINGVLAHYWNGNIMMQATDRHLLKDLVHLWRPTISRPVAGILGADDQAETVIQELNLTNAPYSINRTEGLYSLDLNTLSMPPSAKRYTMVKAQAIDRAVLAQWLKAYNIEALGARDGDALEQQVNNHINKILQEARAWVLLVESQPVSLCGFNATLPDMVQVGPVWTPPDQRGQGFARALVALALRQAEQQGIKKAILFTDNPAATKAYEVIGFKKIGVYRLALLQEPINLPLHKIEL
jgi:predicted GNAT family acetyltransferase